MTFTIYGLRTKGSHECRYVGQTNGDPATRLRAMKNEARNFACNTRSTPTDGHFGHWLLNDEIETYAIAVADTRAEALVAERGFIRAATSLGCRLFNQWHVPLESRIGAKGRVRYIPQAKAA